MVSIERIRLLRKALNKSQTELAQEVGVTQSMVAMWERGASLPSAAKLPDIARALNCTIDELFARDDGQESA